MNYSELKRIFRELKGTFPRDDLTAHVIFTEDSFAKQYPLLSRTYCFSSDNKAFQPNKGGYSIFGDCLDGSDQGVRLEQYMNEEYGGKDGWVVEDCGIAGYVLLESCDYGISTPKLFYTFSDALECMLSLLAKAGDLDAVQLKKDFATTKGPFKEGFYGAGQDSAWLSDSSLDWHWKIQPVCIYGSMKIVFIEPWDKSCPM